MRNEPSTTGETQPYGLLKPCPKCPFRTDVRPYLLRERAREIVASLVRSEFPCHETVDYAAEDEERAPKRPTMHCAGALIMLEHAGRPSQMMRISSRLGLYDPNKLKMDAPVFRDVQSFIDAQDGGSKEEHDPS